MQRSRAAARRPPDGRGALCGRAAVDLEVQQLGLVGGAAKGKEAVLEENRQTAAGGGFGTIVGRNSFQRPHDEAVQLLHDVMDIHTGALVAV